MPLRIVFVDTSKGRPDQRDRTILDDTKVNKEPASDVTSSKVSLHTASKPKARKPLKQPLDPDSLAEIDRLIKKIAGSTLEETMPAPKVEISQAMSYGNNVSGLAKKLALQILKLINFLTCGPFIITSDEIGKWQQLLDKVQDKPEEKPQTELRPQYFRLSHRLDKFTCFGNLPHDIRLLIWKHARPDPRIVRLALSKRRPRAPARSKCPEDWRATYSKTPVPAMLHACSESRQVALKWYRLALQYRKADPRVYFDFSADFLHLRYKDLDILNSKDASRISRLLVSFPRRVDPVWDLTLRFCSAKEILLYDSTSSPLIAETKLSHLKETNRPFKWQKKKDLHTYLLDLKVFWITWIDELVQVMTPQVFLFEPEKLSRVELAVTPETCKIYGFMGKQFKGKFNTPKVMVNTQAQEERIKRLAAIARQSAT